MITRNTFSYGCFEIDQWGVNGDSELIYEVDCALPFPSREPSLMSMATAWYFMERIFNQNYILETERLAEEAGMYLLDYIYYHPERDLNLPAVSDEKQQWVANSLPTDLRAFDELMFNFEFVPGA